jgi:uncharacterized repeat protein (TIGR03803 family)
MNTTLKPKSDLSWKIFRRCAVVSAAVPLFYFTPQNCPGQTYTVLHSFAGNTNEGSPRDGHLILSNATLFGTTCAVGGNNYGTVYKLNTNGTGYTVLKRFTGDDGMDPHEPLVLSGSTLYGTTFQGHGTVFKLNTDGTGFTVLTNFAGSSIAWVNGGLALANGSLYGTSYFGGVSNAGTVFKLNTDGSGFTVLHSFTASEGDKPYAGPILDGNTLYGTTSYGGSGGGSVYKVKTDGSGFTVLKTFPYSYSGGIAPDGTRPVSQLVLSGTTLYGTTAGDGDFDLGTVFRINVDGTGFTVLKHFQGLGDGESIYAGLLLSGTTLYGTAGTGGDALPHMMGHGTVFCVNCDGTGFIRLWQFSATNGNGPVPGVVMSGTTLFGETGNGGSNHYGVVYSLSFVPPTMQQVPQSQSAELGTAATLSVKATGAPAPTYQWFFNGNVLAGCTNFTLCQSCVQSTNAGMYSVVAWNNFGAVTSPPVALNVIAPVPRRPVPGVNVTGQSGSLLNVDYANTLQRAPAWNTFGSVSLTSTSQFCFDLTTPLPAQRFYRAWQTGTPTVVPSLNLNFVPAITLTGNIGDHLRLDCINVIGPTNAWVTLDTVTLTNTTQLYFDVSSIGQPSRLYRIVPVP